MNTIDCVIHNWPRAFLGGFFVIYFALKEFNLAFVFAIKKNSIRTREKSPTLGECRWIMRMAYCGDGAARRFYYPRMNPPRMHSRQHDKWIHLKNDGNKMPNCTKVIPFYIIFDSLIYFIIFSFESLQFVVR